MDRDSDSHPEDESVDYDRTIKRQEPGYVFFNLENLEPGFLLDERYEIKNKLGQGGFGAVYLVHDRRMEVDKAVKIIPEAVVNDLEAMESRTNCWKPKYRDRGP